MRIDRFRISVRQMMVAVAIAAGALSLASGSRTTYYSCHLCHNRKRVKSRLFLGFPVSWHETRETQFPEYGHLHVWWNYARVTDSFLLGSRAGAKPYRYVDRSLGPDGRP